MFDSLDEQIRADDHKAVSSRERAIKWVIGALVAIAVFGGLIVGVHRIGG